MKNILVLTDFSVNAGHAALSAVNISARMHTNLILFHSSLQHPVMPHYAGGPWVPEDFAIQASFRKKEFERLMGEMQTQPITPSAEQRRPVIHTLSGEGDLGTDVAEVIKHKNIELIVMGSSNKSTLEHLLYGRETQSVLQKSTRPVLIIPPDRTVTDIQKVVFATDYSEADTKAIGYLTKLFKTFHFHLELIHVRFYEDKGNKEEQKAVFARKLVQIKIPDIAYKEIRGKHLANRLNDFCKEGNSDLLALVHHQYPLLKSLFTHSDTKKILENLKFPALIFPSHLDD